MPTTLERPTRRERPTEDTRAPTAPTRGALQRWTVVVLVAVVALIACGGDDDAANTVNTTSTEAPTTTPDATPAQPTTTEPSTQPEDNAAIEAYCQKNEELVAVRGAVYGQPFTETPEEIKALLAEAAVLQDQLDLLVPDEIRQAHDVHMAEFVAPIDALTEDLGWDPFAAINTQEAAAIFADPEINASTEDIMVFLTDHCGVEPPPEG